MMVVVVMMVVIGNLLLLCNRNYIEDFTFVYLNLATTL